MVELFINNRRVDLPKDAKIALTFKSVDVDNPTVVHGGYSKTVVVEATKNNNEIFGDAWRFDRAIVSGEGDNLIGIKFNSRLRVDAVLVDNGDVVMNGYCQLNNIKCSKGKIEYNITLYSSINDFFYNLMYDENGEEKTLYSLYWGFKSISDGHKMSKDEEDKMPLFFWNKDFIKDGWINGCDSWDGSTREEGINPKDIIVGAPTYGGTYDDFDNSKILTKWDDLDNETRNKIYHGGYNWEGFNPYKGWVLTEATRDLDEHEVRDLRSKYQRSAVRMKAILETICDPINNGGYTVEWDKEILDNSTSIGRIFNKTFVVYERFNFDDDETANNVDTLKLEECRFSPYIPFQDEYPMSGEGFFYKELGSQYEFDTTNYLYPNFSVSIRPTVSGDTSPYNYKSEYLYTSYLRKFSYGEYNNLAASEYQYGGIAVSVECYKDDVIINETPTYLITTDICHSRNEFGYGIADCNKILAERIGIDESKLVIFQSSLKKEKDKVFKFEKELKLSMELPQDEGLRFRLKYKYVAVSSVEKTFPSQAYPTIRIPLDSNVERYMQLVRAKGNIEMYVNEDDDTIINGIYDGDINPMVQKQAITKKILFGTTDSPYDYLIGFAKILGLKFITDTNEKKVYILQKKNYFIDEVVDIDGKIDRNREVIINPTLCESKWYKYGLESIDSYADDLYNKKNNNEYGTLKINTNYYFNNDTKNLYDGIIFKNVIPYRQNSIFYNSLNSAPCTMLAPTFDVTMYKDGEEGIENKSLRFYGYSHGKDLSKVFDAIPKVCGFGDDNSNVDIAPSLLFYDGMDDSMKGYILSDNIEAMLELNGNACFMYCPWMLGYESVKDSEEKVVSYYLDSIPRFSKYLKNNI